MKICHFTSAHQTTDDRIFLKECHSLQKNGYDVFIVGKGDSQTVSGIQIVGCGAVQSRIKRLFLFARQVYKHASALDCDVYHFHDPELLSYGLKLKNKGKKVIFDSHEDVPAQIMDKTWIPKPLRKLVSITYRAYETHVVRQIDAVVAATPHIAKQFEGRAKKTVVVNNYPRLDDIVFHDTSFADREPIVCYAGGINEIRGEKVMVEAMKDVDGVLILAGDHEVMTLRENRGGGYSI